MERQPCSVNRWIDGSFNLLCRHNPGNAAQQVHPSCMLCMLRQERSIAQAKLCQNAHQFGKLWRETFNLNQESGQANFLLLHLCILSDACLHSIDYFFPVKSATKDCMLWLWLAREVS